MRFHNPSDRDIVEWLPGSRPDRRIRYGDDPLQFGDLRIPTGAAAVGGHPVAVVLHGGGYSPNWTLDSVAPLAEALANGGVATWNLEYRRPGQTGGGWPGTWLDIAHGIDHLRVIAGHHELDLNRIVAVGHSAGATFAAWAAARASMGESEPLHGPDPLLPSGVLSLAGMLDLQREWDDGPEPPRHLRGLLTDHPSDRPEVVRARLDDVSPIGLAGSITAAQRLVVGSLDAPVMIAQTRAYAGACSALGHPVDVRYLDGANHFDLIDPSGAAWPVVAGAVHALLGDRLGPSSPTG